MKTKIYTKVSLPRISEICYTYFTSKKTEDKNMVFEDPTMVDLSVRLAEVAAKNTASAVFGKLKAVKAGHDKDKTISEMQELIHELLTEKQELELIAKSYEEEMVAQRLKESDLEFVVKTVLPAVKDFMGKISNDEGELAKNLKNIEALEPLLSLDSLIVLQTLGFNYKKGIGEPLTSLTRGLINSPKTSNHDKMAELNMEKEVEYLKLIRDPEAFERFKIMNGFN